MFALIIYGSGFLSAMGPVQAKVSLLWPHGSKNKVYTIDRICAYFKTRTSSEQVSVYVGITFNTLSVKIHFKDYQVKKSYVWDSV